MSKEKGTDENQSLEIKEESEMSLFTGVEGATGFEDTTADSFKLPILKVLSKGSPQVDEDHANFVPGAKAGKFINISTNELYDELNVIPLTLKHEIFVWSDDNSLVGVYPLSEKNKLVVDNDGRGNYSDVDGNKVVETMSFYLMFADDPTTIVVMSLNKTALKHGKSWATRLKALKMNGKPVGVAWAGVWNIKPVKNSNANYTWYNIGSSPDFQRFITAEERDTFILPATEMLKEAIVEHEEKPKTEETVDMKY